jgi:hypothetical protein
LKHARAFQRLVKRYVVGESVIDETTMMYLAETAFLTELCPDWAWRQAKRIGAIREMGWDAFETAWSDVDATCSMSRDRFQAVDARETAALCYTRMAESTEDPQSKHLLACAAIASLLDYGIDPLDSPPDRTYRSDNPNRDDLVWLLLHRESYFKKIGRRATDALVAEVADWLDRIAHQREKLRAETPENVKRVSANLYLSADEARRGLDVPLGDKDGVASTRLALRLFAYVVRTGLYGQAVHDLFGRCQKAQGLSAAGAIRTWERYKIWEGALAKAKEEALDPRRSLVRPLDESESGLVGLVTREAVNHDQAERAAERPRLAGLAREEGCGESRKWFDEVSGAFGTNRTRCNSWSRCDYCEAKNKIMWTRHMRTILVEGTDPSLTIAVVSPELAAKLRSLVRKCGGEYLCVRQDSGIFFAANIKFEGGGTLPTGHAIEDIRKAIEAIPEKTSSGQIKSPIRTSRAWAVPKRKKGARVCLPPTNGAF